MNPTLIYLSEGIKFDLDSTMAAITSIDGVVDAKMGDFSDALFECVFTHKSEDEVIVRISKSLNTVTTDGTLEASLQFIFLLQERMPMDLWITDINLDFNLNVNRFASAGDLMSAVQGA